MQEISKVSIDMLFCIIIGFLIIQASSASNHNQKLNSTLNAESARISANNR